MYGPGHHATGMATGVVVAHIAHTIYEVDFAMSAVAVAAAWLGGVFPDRIEKPIGFYIVPHRTISHWVPLWISALVAILFFPETIWLNTALSQMIALGFVSGGITHLLFDLPTPSGIPILTPFRHVSLNLWRSGSNDFLLTAVWWLFAGLIVAPERLIPFLRSLF